MNQREIKFRAWDKEKEYNVFTKKPKRKGDKGWYKRQGYIMRLVSEHPFATKRGYVNEHRLVMEENLGRFLLPTEIIHHRDQNRENNELSNLELRGNQGEHATENLRGKRNPHGEFIAQEPIFSELKFRLFNKNTKTTRIYTLATLIGTTFRRGQFEFRGRWTGLKDKNGKEVFEGDIVNWNLGTIKRPIIWNNERTRFEIDGDSYYDYWWEDIEKLEVIGNIYENPELIGE